MDHLTNRVTLHHDFQSKKPILDASKWTSSLYAITTSWNEVYSYIRIWLLQSAHLLNNVEAEIKVLIRVKIKTIGKMFEQYSILKFDVNVIRKKKIYIIHIYRNNATPAIKINK